MTQENLNQGEEADNQNSPSWEQVLEKEVTEVYPQDKFGDYAALAKSAFEKGMNRARDYYEKEVVGPLQKRLEITQSRLDEFMGYTAKLGLEIKEAINKLKPKA